MSCLEIRKISILFFFVEKAPYLELCLYPQVNLIYRIRPNYRTVRLGFSNLQDTLICGKICIYLLRIHYKKRSEKDLFNDDYVIFSDFLYKGICC